MFPIRSRLMRSALLGSLALASSSGLWLACDDSIAIKEPSPNAARTSGGGSTAGDAARDGQTKDCFDDPKTHFEIINACTTATKITKNPSLPKLHPDGSLPPLQ